MSENREDQYRPEEARRRLEAALRGARKVGPKPMKDKPRSRPAPKPKPKPRKKAKG